MLTCLPVAPERAAATPIRHLIYRKLGRHRGKLRLWLEGERLTECDLPAGARISIQRPRRGTLTIVLDEQGERVVAQRKKDETPIIDINSHLLAEALGDVERVRVIFYDGRIEVSLHPDDLAATERVERLLGKLSRGEKLATGSLSHGGGILDNALHEGLELSGVSCRLGFANDIEARYLDTSRANNPIWDRRSVSVLAPMQEIETHLLPKVEVFAAGIPCTGASKGGKAKNKNAHTESHPAAGALFLAFLNVIKAVQPAVIILENVPDYQKSASMEVIRSCLDSWGYELHETILDARQLGGFEDRKRLCAVAVTRGLQHPFSLEKLLARKQRAETLGELLEPVVDDERYRSLDGLKRKEAEGRKKGHNFKLQLVTAASEKVGTIGRLYWKYRHTEPLLLHEADPERARLLTPAEHARGKDIPEHLVEGCCNTLAHEILGQSVSREPFVLVGQRIGAWLRAVAQPFLPQEPAACGDQLLLAF